MFTRPSPAGVGRIAAISVIAAAGLTLAAPAWAAEPSYAPDPDDFQVRITPASCTVDRVRVSISYAGDTAEIGVGLITGGHAEAGRERVEPGSTVTLTGAPLEYGESRSYRVTTTFLDDQSGRTTLREFTVQRPGLDACGPTPTPSASPQDGSGAAPDPDDYQVQVTGPSCTADRVQVRVTYRGDTDQIAVGLLAGGHAEAAREQVEPGGTVTLTGTPLEYGESRPYRVITAFLDDDSGRTTLHEFTARRPATQTCSVNLPTLPTTGPDRIPMLALGGLLAIAVGVLGRRLVRRTTR